MAVASTELAAGIVARLKEAHVASARQHAWSGQSVKQYGDFYKPDFNFGRTFESKL